MIQIIQRGVVPYNVTICKNCHSILKYGNADLFVRSGSDTQNLYSCIYNYCFTCPVCGLDVAAKWIESESGEDNE